MSHSPEYQREWKAKNPDKVSAYGKRYRKKLLDDPESQKAWNAKKRAEQNEYDRKKRNEAIDFLGGKCAQCGFSDRRALQFDHINGGGSKEQKAARSRSGHHRKVWQSILKGEGKFQILCANCNWIKRHEQNENNTWREMI